MEIIRRIGKFDVLIESDEPCGIYFEESALPPGSGKDGVVLGKSEMLGILASGDDYLPLTLHWELLDRCNFACPFCYIVGHSFKKVIRFADIRSHLTELIREGLLFCTLTGGEVTIHPDFKDIYRFLKDRGVIVEVFTNGYAIDNGLVELFHSHPPLAVEVSLYSLDDERLREIYGVHDRQAASKVLENVLEMNRAGVNVICKTFHNTITDSDIEDIAFWCKQHEIQHYSSSSLTQAYDGADLRCYAVDRDPVQVKESGDAVCLPCKTRNYGSAIDASFSIFPCPSIRLADCTFDLRQLGVAESLRRMKEFMRRFQDAVIQGGECGSSGCASCMAHAKPVRDEAGELLHFARS
ncbi:MAG TPA: radical SAM protein [Verrucomicrobiae bacterium]|nr:radical SAM protein [Verrucomicrobiae bacterium]